MVSSLRHSWRIIKIARVLAKHDALFLFEQWGVMPGLVSAVKLLSLRRSKGRPGERLAKAFQELGPAFVKLGQALSTRSDLLSDEVAEDLAMLRDNLPPFPGDYAIDIIENEFEKSLKKIFPVFEKEPVAAASIAQVHFAEDKEGNKLAVKVLRPDIEKRFARDVEFMFWVAMQLEKHLPKMELLKLQEVVQVFADAVRMEMDLRLEAAAADKMRKNFTGDESVHIPKIYWDKTSQRVLTMERIKGINVDDVKALKKAKLEPQQIVKELSQTLFKMTFRDGYFHADMHPGNLFVDKKGRLILVDFGIMGSLDKQFRFFVAEMLFAFMNRDFDKVAKMHFALGLVPDSQSQEQFTQACQSIAEPILGLPQNEISLAKLLSQLFKVAEDFHMNLQPQFLMLQKAIMLAEGVSRKVYPKVNMWKLAEPLIEEWADDNLGLEAKVKEELTKIRNLGNRLERLVKSIEDCFTPQGVKLHPETIEALAKKKKSKENVFWKILLIATVILLVLYIAAN